MGRHQSKTVCVGNLPTDAEKQEVENLFLKYGRVDEIDLRIPPRPSGYAFVKFKDYRDAKDASRGRDGYSFGGNQLKVELTHGGEASRLADRHRSNRGRRSRPIPSRHCGYRVLVTGLPSSASWKDLERNMGQAGDMLNCEVLSDSHGTRGIVGFTSYNDMKYALRKLNGSRFVNSKARAYIQVREYSVRRNYSRSPSPSQSRSPSPSPRQNPYYSRSPSPSQSPIYSRSPFPYKRVPKSVRSGRVSRNRSRSS